MDAISVRGERPSATSRGELRTPSSEGMSTGREEKEDNSAYEKDWLHREGHGISCRKISQRRRNVESEEVILPGAASEGGAAWRNDLSSVRHRVSDCYLRQVEARDDMLEAVLDLGTGLKWLCT